MHICLFRSWTNYLNVLQGVHMKWVPKMIRQTHIITVSIQSIDTLKGDKKVTSMSTLFITDKLLGVYIYIKLWRQGNQPLSPISLTDIKERRIWCRAITTQILEILTTVIRWLVHWAFSCSWRMSFLIFVAWGMTPILVASRNGIVEMVEKNPATVSYGHLWHRQQFEHSAEGSRE